MISNKTDTYNTLNWESRPVFPFSAILGQEEMQKALLLNAILPSIGGVLLRGEKGTAKSTAVRALAHILPEREVVADCPFNCDPHVELCQECQKRIDQGHSLPSKRQKVQVVDLPLGASEDRIIGALDMEEAIKKGIKALQPGILAKANQNILYIDEVNLLPDHLVDVILDSAGFGYTIVEREGISYEYPSNFILFGSMNPEEGEIRPQLLDRFGLCVEVSTPGDPHIRKQVLKRWQDFEGDPEVFIKNWKDEQLNTYSSILKARDRVDRIELPGEIEDLCSNLCLEANVAGHRADLALRRAACALAALKAREKVEEEDVREVAEMVLVHRRRTASPPPEQQPEENEEQDREEQEEQSHKHDKEQQDSENAEAQGQEDSSSQQQEQGETEEYDETNPPQEQQEGTGQENIFPVGDTFQVKPINFQKDRIPRKGSGRRTRSRTQLKTGRYVKSRPRNLTGDLALDATLRAAAPYQKQRDNSGLAVAVRDSDIREKIRENQGSAT